jgi:hypothetical protein
VIPSNTTEAVIYLVRNELERAMAKHSPMVSPHEGYAVLKEEVDELWDRVKRDDGRSGGAVHEAIQVAAMGLRYVLDVCSGIDLSKVDQPAHQPYNPECPCPYCPKNRRVPGM